MAFESDFDNMLAHTVLCSTYSSIDGYGKPTYSASNSSYTARVTYKQKLVRALDGTEQVSNANAVMNCTEMLRADSKYTLPDGTVRPILSIEQISDTGGVHHSVIYFGGQSKKG